MRTFVAYEIKGEPYLLAAYTCTPLVKIPVSELKPGAHVKGTTIAELGNRNRPLDMIVYQKDGKDYLLLANNSRGVMKIPTEGADATEAITARVAGTKGLGYETIQGMKGVDAARQARLGPRPGPRPWRFGLAEPGDGRPAVNATEITGAAAGSRHRRPAPACSAGWFPCQKRRSPSPALRAPPPDVRG